MISVIIPTYNEEGTIQKTIASVYARACYKRLIQEVIVVDGGSSDRTVSEAKKAGANVIVCPEHERSIQLNYGAHRASGKILYFLLADVTPPENFTKEIVRAFQKGYYCGSFCLKFDYKHWMLNMLSWFSQLKKPLIHLSDQSLFVTKELFHKAGEFREDHKLMGFHEIIKRLKRYSDFIVLKDKIVSSANRYLRHGIIRTEIVKILVYGMYLLGYSQQKLLNIYRLFFKQRSDVQKSFSAEEAFTLRKA
jgi:rSAM/selenodomain-associated transferase 2